ncbi:Cysteine dioxygenase [Dinochytrium kinnereticum]|nr:Cysteine dioxygenase [Dinochytrium kinnereticum]
MSSTVTTTEASTTSTSTSSSSPPTPKTLDDLIKALHAEMSDKGIHEMDKVNVDRVKALMESYVSNPAEWSKYAHWDPRKYTRNLVDDGNGKFNLMVLCWPENQSSAIHDHAGSHCLMKVLDGAILETQYQWPESQGAPMEVKVANTHTENRVAYIHDKIGLHRVSNPSPSVGAVSLHLYCPPYDNCKTFCESTSTSRGSGKCLFYSEHGRIVKHIPPSYMTGSPSGGCSASSATVSTITLVGASDASCAVGVLKNQLQQTNSTASMVI